MKKLRIELVLFILVVLIELGFILSTHSNYLIDDAFITFRYSRNLIDGLGLVWNLNGEPTQGYTNFLFVILMAMGFILNIEPTKFALILNIFGLVLLQASVFLFLRDKKVSLPLRLFCIVCIGLYSATVMNLNSGLETLFLTGLIFCSLFLHSKAPSTKRTVLLFAILFIATLTRPEGLIFVVCWSVISILNYQKNKLEKFMILFYLIGLSSYLVFNFLYFGYVLPNSALVKISQPFQFPGLLYLKLTFSDNRLLVFTTAFMTLLIVVFMKPKKDYLDFVPFFLLIPFYLMTDPYMGMYGRYYYPLIICLIIILAFETDLISKKILVFSSSVIVKHDKYLSTIFRIFVYIPLIIVFIQSIHFNYKEQIQPFEQPLLSKEIEIGKKLALQDFSKDILFAYGDAGSIPYYSGVRFLDLVGLNDNSIALYARSRGGDGLSIMC